MDVKKSDRDGTPHYRSPQSNLARSFLLLLNQVSGYFVSGLWYRSVYPPLPLTVLLSLPFRYRLLLPRPRGKTEHGCTHTPPWCNIRHWFINCLNHQILHISDWILYTCCYCSRHFATKAETKVWGHRDILNCHSCAPGEHMSLPPKSLPLLEFVSAPVPAKSYCEKLL